MAITQAVCTSFKQELLVGTHNFTATTGDTFKIALYTSSASLDATTTAYSSSNEVSNSGTYTATGGTLTSVTPTTSGTTAIAALEVGRNYLGSEINEEYYNICKKRIESDLTLR